MNRLALAFGLFLCAPLATTSAQQLGTQRIATGLQKPSYVCQAPGDDTRLFILERYNGVKIIKNGVANPQLFLDISSRLTTNEGLVGMAFHPDYQNNGRFFLTFLDKDMITRLEEFAVTGDPDIADPNSAIEIVPAHQQTYASHNWNCIQFGPDGMLYAGFGDAVEVNDDGTTNNSQDLSNNLGKILRIDVDNPPTYVPADNPFVGQSGVDELIWIYGVRNPWRFDFDPVTNDLYIADVGRLDWEEIDILPFASAAGKNLGWRCLEGTMCTNYVPAMGSSAPGCLSCGDPSYWPPAFEYDHSGGKCCIIGGEVYRGSDCPSLYGKYLYADFCSSRFWCFEWDGAQVTNHIEITSELLPDLGPPIDFPTSFGQDNDGEVYILSNSGSELYKIVEVDCHVNNFCTSTMNSAGTVATMGSQGTTSIGADDFVLTADGVLPNKVGQFFYGPNQIQVPFGEGFRCVGGGIYRMYPIGVADGTGFVSRALDYANPPQPAGQIQAGATWNFQYWYRDAMTPGTFNLTDGLEAAFCP